MNPKTNKRTVPELRVAFDTNALFTQSERYLVNKNIADFIRANSNHQDLKITWHLPEIVMDERQYQMRIRGMDLLPAIQKLERLIGVNLNVTQRVIEDHIKSAIENQVSELSLKLLPLESGSVDWVRLVQDAAYRRGTFEPGEREKGFRDSIVAEIFVQLVVNSPTTPTICRVALITNDTLLQESVKFRLEGRKNVRILNDLNELQDLVDTLVANVQEEFIASIKKPAQELFYSTTNRDNLYNRDEVRKLIIGEFKQELAALPDGADSRDNSSTWYISAPRFVSKVKQRITWASRVRIDAKALKQPAAADVFAKALQALIAKQSPNTLTYKSPLPMPLFAAPAGGLTGAFSSSESKPTQASPPEPPAPILVANGRTEFDVIWSTTVTLKTRRLTTPKIERIQHVQTTWDSPES